MSIQNKFIGTDDVVRFCRENTGLLWRLNMENRSLTLLNHIEIAGLEGRVEDLIQNLVKAQDIVIQEDFFRFKLFIKSVRDGNEASVIFRTRCSRGLQHWLKAAGAPSNSDRYIYYGYIRDITGDVDLINHMLEKELERQVMIQHEENPVILVDMETKAVISRNTYANRLFTYSFDEFNRLKFQDLFPVEQKTGLSSIYEACLLEGKWAGNLLMLKKGNKRFEAVVNIKRLSIRDRNLLKLSIYESGKPIKGQEGLLPERETFSQNLTGAMEDVNTMDAILSVLLKNQYGLPRFNAIMCIEPHLKKGKVRIYGSGEPLASLQPGISFEYEGITRLIGENQQELLIVKDTMESVNPIDWALFIPYGIRSYAARSFFHGTKLKALLVFCSTETNRFTDMEKDIFELYNPAFLKSLRKWKKRKK